MLPAALRPKLFLLVAGLGLYLLTTGIAFAAFNFLRTEPQSEFANPLPGEGGGLAIDPGEPKTESCLLNGKLYTKTEKKAWETRRPLVVMIENHSEARPQSGITKADIVYEAVAEGGITRFLAVYLCDAVARDTMLGPVRSARTYFLDWASEYGLTPLYVHVGGANLPGPANALGQIQEYGWGGRNGNDLNQFAIGYPTFWRDYERIGHTVATEHTMYTTTEKLWGEGKRRGWTNKDLKGIDWQDQFQSWKLEEKETEGPEANKVSFEFWQGGEEYAVTWEYNSQSKDYARLNNGQAHTDLNNGEQIKSRVVIVQFLNENGPIDELKHILYKTISSGKALVFQDGKMTEANWQKISRKARTVFTGKNGKELTFAPGKIWIEILPTGNTVDY